MNTTYVSQCNNYPKVPGQSLPVCLTCCRKVAAPRAKRAGRNAKQAQIARYGKKFYLKHKI